MYWPREPSLPDPSEVAEIRVLAFSDPGRITVQSAFVMPSSYHGELLSCLQQNRRVKVVAAYIFGGAMMIRTYDGREYFVDFFFVNSSHSPNDQDPFSIQPVVPPGKDVYYYGADSQRLCEIIESAWRKAEAPN